MSGKLPLLIRTMFSYIFITITFSFHFFVLINRGQIFVDVQKEMDFAKKNFVGINIY